MVTEQNKSYTFSDQQTKQQIPEGDLSKKLA
jgi:hypothetical protein